MGLQFYCLEPETGGTKNKTSICLLTFLADLPKQMEGSRFLGYAPLVAKDNDNEMMTFLYQDRSGFSNAVLAIAPESSVLFRLKQSKRFQSV